MALTETAICNMALRTVGAKRITTLSAGNAAPEAVECLTWYEYVRDALLRSYDWPFARARAQLVVVTAGSPPAEVTPAFEYDHQFALPTDFLRVRNYYDTDSGYENARKEWVLEGGVVLTNYSSVYLRYLKKVTDPTQFDTLFVELLALRLAIKLINGLAGIENMGTLRDRLNQEANLVEARARVVAASESDPFDQPEYIRSRFTDKLLVI